MALSELTGLPQAYPQGLLEESTIQQANLGAIAFDSQGRKYRYCKAGATALVPGKLQQSPAEVANHTNEAVAAAAAVGATQVTITLGATAATANQYAEGLLVINDAAGEGETYRIKSHPAADASAALVVTLDDSIRTALTTSSEATLVANKYNGVIVHPTTSSGVPVGVAILDITAGSYGWVQDGGEVSCLNDSGTAIGLGVAPSTNTAGAVMTVAATTNQVGSAVVAGVSTEYNPINLTL
jgi:hypothetical protein